MRSFTVRLSLIPFVFAATASVCATATAQTWGYSEDAARPSSADYMNTLHIRWNLPQGWRYASASGVFSLENTAEAVPEPASVFALGAGALAMVRRRSRVAPAGSRSSQYRM